MEARVSILACTLGLSTVIAAIRAEGISGEMARASRASEDAGQVRRIEVVASRYEFTPSRIEVEEGDTVELSMRSADTEHGLAVKEYGLKVRIPKGGAPVSARFVANRPGRFTIGCSEYCGSGHRRMKAELVVQEARP